MSWLIIVFLTGILAGGALGLLGAWLALDLRLEGVDGSLVSGGGAMAERSQPIPVKEPGQISGGGNPLK